MRKIRLMVLAVLVLILLLAGSVSIPNRLATQVEGEHNTLSLLCWYRRD